MYIQDLLLWLMRYIQQSGLKLDHSISEDYSIKFGKFDWEFEYMFPTEGDIV